MFSPTLCMDYLSDWKVNFVFKRTQQLSVNCEYFKRHWCWIIGLLFYFIWSATRIAYMIWLDQSKIK